MKRAGLRIVRGVIINISLLIALGVLLAEGMQAHALGCSTSENPKFCLSTARKGPQVRLDLAQDVVRPGGILRSQIKNGSVEDFSYGRARSLQRFEHGRWVHLPEQQVLNMRFVVRAGEVGRWQSIRIPESAQPGRYRLRQIIMPIGSGQGKQVPLFGHFKVCHK